MSKPQVQNHVKPEELKGKIKLPNQEIKVDINAVNNSGQRASIAEIIKNLKKAAKKQLFPPIATSQNG